MRIVKLICETDTCQNKGIGIDLDTEALAYACGACGQEITNAVEVTDGGK